MEHVDQMISQILFHFTPEIFFEFMEGYWMVLAIIILGYILHYIPRSIDFAMEQRIIQLPLVGKAAVLLLVIIISIQVKSSSIQPFIYFQF